MNKPIGIIDSGVGGLTVFKEIKRQLPRESLIYLGDIARCPYGSKKKSEIIQYTKEMVNFLLGKNIKMLVIACNTATAYTIQLLEKELNIPVIGVIRPGALTAIQATRKKHVAVIGTEATIQSKAYETELKTIHPNIEVTSIPCPKFVPLIEKSILEGPIIEREIDGYLSHLKTNEDVDVLVLGCTHYPLISKSIKKFLGNKIKIVSSGAETAREVSALLQMYKINNYQKETPQYFFYTTAPSKTFELLSNQILNGETFNIETINLDIVSI